MSEDNNPKTSENLKYFEQEQQRALLICELLYGEKFRRPTKCCVDGCNSIYIYNSGYCIEHAF